MMKYILLYAAVCSTTYAFAFIYDAKREAPLSAVEKNAGTLIDAAKNMDDESKRCVESKPLHQISPPTIASLYAQAEKAKPESKALLQTLVKLEFLTDDELVQLIESPLENTASDNPSYILKYMAAVYFARNKPENAYHLLTHLSDDNLKQVGYALIAGLRHSEPMYAWQWIDQNSERKGENLGLSHNQFKQLIGDTLISLAKHEDFALTALHYGQKHLASGIDTTSFPLMEVAKHASTIAPHKILDYLKTTMKEDQVDENVFTGYTRYLLEESGLPAATEFVIENGKHASFFAAIPVSESYIEGGDIIGLREFITRISDERLKNQVLRNSAEKLIDKNINESIGLMELKSDPESKLSLAMDIEIHMRWKPQMNFSFVDHLRVYEEAVPDKDMLWESYYFAGMLENWSDIEPQSVAAYIDQINAGDPDIAAAFNKNYQRIAKR